MTDAERKVVELLIASHPLSGLSDKEAAALTALLDDARRYADMCAAVRNLRDVRGRHHSEIATRRIFDLLPDAAQGAG